MGIDSKEKKLWNPYVSQVFGVELEQTLPFKKNNNNNNFCASALYFFLRTTSLRKVFFTTQKSALSRTIPTPEFQKDAMIATDLSCEWRCARSLLWISLAFPVRLDSCPTANWHLKLHCNCMLNNAKTLRLGGISFTTAEPCWLFHSDIMLTKLVIFTHIRHISHMSSITTSLQE